MSVNGHDVVISVGWIKKFKFSKKVKCPGSCPWGGGVGVGGMLKLRFGRYITQRNSWKSNIFDADSILKKKKSNALVFWYSLFSKNKDFNNGNLIRMREQVDISSCYSTIEKTWSRLINKLFWLRFTIFTGLRCFRFWRLPSGTQDNSQVLFRKMSKCVNKQGLGKFGGLPHEE